MRVCLVRLRKKTSFLPMPTVTCQLLCSTSGPLHMTKAEQMLERSALHLAWHCSWIRLSFSVWNVWRAGNRYWMFGLVDCILDSFDKKYRLKKTLLVAGGDCLLARIDRKPQVEENSVIVCKHSLPRYLSIVNFKAEEELYVCEYFPLFFSSRIFRDKN